jgi:hypothetical protein
MTIAPTPVPRRHTPHGLYLVLLTILVILIGTAVVLLARNDWGGHSSSTIGLHGSGIAATQSRTVPSFTAVDLAGATNVIVHIGGKQAVVVEADDNLINLVTTGVHDGTLVLGTKGSFTTERPMTVDVTISTLDAVVLSGSGVVTVEGVGAEQLTVRVPGSGLLNISGTAERLDVSLAGSGDVQLQDLIARDVAATLSGSGRLQVHATSSLEASVSGTGVIVYSGNPSNVTQDVTGTGAITKR